MTNEQITAKVIELKEALVAHKNFLDSINSRKEPLVPVEVGHSSGTVCTLGNIAHELQQELNWNPVSQTFIGKKKLNKKLHYNYRKGYKEI